MHDISGLTLSPRRPPIGPAIYLAVCLCGLPALAAPNQADAPATPDTPAQALATALRQSIGAPARADLGDQATERLDGDLIIMPRQEASRLLTAMHHPVPADFIALLIGSEGMDAPGTIRFVPAGFIDSDAAMALSADDILDSLRDTVEHDNPARLQNNQDQREVRSWIREPRYIAKTHQLSWAALILPKTAPRESDGEITFHALSFGRAGYIQLSVIGSLQQADAIGHMADTFLAGLNFVPGKSYRDVTPDDPLAPGGLAAAMGLATLHKARNHGSFWGSDTVVPAAGGGVAAIGALALFLYFQRQLRQQARRS